MDPAGAPHEADPQPQHPWRRHLVALHNPHPSPLSGTQDLISHFQLDPLYDTYLRPYLPPALQRASSSFGQPEIHAPQGADDPAANAGPTAGGAAGGQSSLLPGGGTAALQPPGPGTNALSASAPTSPATAASQAQAGLKITLGGIKLAGLNGPASATEPDPGAGAGTAAGGGKKPRKAKMDKSYEYMIGDVLGRLSQPRSAAASASAPPSLLHLVSNPDPTPCPPLHPFDPQQLREAFTLKPGRLEGFDMSAWEARDPNAAAASEEKRKKKKKRKHPDDPNPGSGGGGGIPGGAANPKRQKR
ncbi:hypothetical protein JCM8202_001700 [Rhodotorula sphaerocarpa]